MQPEDLRAIDAYFLQTKEPAKSCLLFLREFILQQNKDVTEVWRYRMPFYCFRGKRFCYLWIQKKTGWPYLGIVDGKKISHPRLIQENRTRMKIMLIDPTKDIPVRVVREILKKVLIVQGPKFKV